MSDDFFRPAHVHEYFPKITADQIYTWIKRSKPLVALRPGGREEITQPGNGFDKVYTKKGRSIWISRQRMEEWFRGWGQQ